jgi:capsular polysaccharide biosynthesis protein
MRRLFQFAIRLYPAAWRARYAREFDALLDDLAPRWHDLWDIFLGAISMHISSPALYLKLGTVTAVLGALVALGISLRTPPRYDSSAVLRIMAPPNIGEERLLRLQSRVLSRSNLAEVIQRPSLDLYRHARTQYPLEQVIEDMRRRDLHIERVDANPGVAFRIRFEYPDPDKAQAVVKQLVSNFTEGDPVRFEVLDPASRPQYPVPTNRLPAVVIGFGIGLVIGILVSFLRGRPLLWTLKMAASSAIGFGIALAIALYQSFDPTPFACLGACAALAFAAFLMRDRSAAPISYLKSAMAAGVVAAIAGGFVSFAFPDRFVSTAGMRMFETEIAEPTVDLRGRLETMREMMLAPNSLAEMIQRPALDLYRKERKQRPLEDIVEEMRRDIHIQTSGVSPLAISISVANTDPRKAQAVVRELVARIAITNMSMERDLNRDVRAPGAILAEVMEPANFPVKPIWPNRLYFIGGGLVVGSIIGLLIAFVRRGPPQTLVPHSAAA